MIPLSQLGKHVIRLFLYIVEIQQVMLCPGENAARNSGVSKTNFLLMPERFGNEIVKCKTQKKINHERLIVIP